MKKNPVNTFGLISLWSVAAFALLVQACGGGNNNTPVPLACMGQNCPGAALQNPLSNPLALVDAQITGNKQAQYAELCTSPYTSVRHFIINGVNVCRFRLEGWAKEESINDGAMILTPNSTSGGLNTGIHVFEGDSLELSAEGHYSHRKPSVWKEAVTVGLRSGCHNEISVDGSLHEDDGDEHVIQNRENGQPAGLFMALSNGRSFTAEPMLFGHETRNLSVIGSEDLIVGYNTTRIECGSIKLRYRINRCMDANLNTYPCPKE